jgi:rod shape-determining protein MreC
MQKKFSIVLLIIVFVTILMFIESKGLLGNTFSFVRGASTPVSILFSDISHQISDTFSGVFNLSKLQKENAEIKDANNRLQAEVAQLQEAKKENEKLRADLKFVSSANYTYEAAEVTVFEPSNLRGMITINKGTKNGIKPGMAVISEGFMIGKIVEAAESNSKVILITDPSSAIPVTLQQANTSGLARGQIGAGIVMEKIPQGEKITEGDTVITSGLGGEIPRGLILGFITKVDKQDNSLFVTGDIRPAANLHSLSRLIIIKN